MTAGNDAAYRISTSEHAAASDGIAILAICGHVLGSGRHQNWQPAVAVEFRDLVLTANTVGQLDVLGCTSTRHGPDAVGPPFVIGAEPGRLHAPLGKKIRSQPEDVQHAITELLYGVAGDFLTDHRVTPAIATSRPAAAATNCSTAAAASASTTNKPTPRSTPATGASRPHAKATAHDHRRRLTAPARRRGLDNHRLHAAARRGVRWRRHRTRLAGSLDACASGRIPCRDHLDLASAGLVGGR